MLIIQNFQGSSPNHSIRLKRNPQFRRVTLGKIISRFASGNNNLVMSRCHQHAENVMIKLCNFLNVDKNRGFSGMYSIVRRISISQGSVQKDNIMYRWTNGGETWRETNKNGGDLITTRMDKWGSKPKPRRKIYLCLSH